jgi:hypothetical protein
VTYSMETLRDFIGVTSQSVTASEPVEAGAVRRFAQAIMDEDLKYGDPASVQGGQRLAPPLFPAFMFRRPLGTVDPVTQRAGDDYFDGLTLAINTGLPELPLDGMSLLNGGAEIEFYDYAKHGERISQQTRYRDIYEKVSSKGPMIFVVTETDYRNDAGALLLRIRQVNIRR